MPTVPYPVRRVEPTPMPDIRVPTDAPIAAFPGAVDRSLDLSGVQHALGDIYQREVDHTDQVAVNTSTATLEDKATDIQAKAMSLHGLDAGGAAEQARADYQSAVDTIRSGLTSERQRMLFDQRAAGRWAQMHDTLAQHMVTERQNADVDSSNALIDGARNDALTNFTDPTKVQAAIQKQAAIYSDFAARNGIPAPVVQQHIAGTTSATQVGVINRLLEMPDGGDLAAKNYYATVTDQLTGADRGRIDEVLKAGSTLAESRRQAARILGTTDNLSDALAAAKELPDTGVSDQTRTRIKQEYLDRADADRLADDTRFQNALNGIDRDHTIDTIPKADWAQFSYGERRQLQDYAAGNKPPMDWQWWNDHTAQLENPVTRQDTINLPYAELRAHLDDQHLGDWITLRNGVAKGDLNAEVKLAGYRTVGQTVDGVLKSAGLDVNDKDAATQARIEQLRRTVDLGVTAARQANGGKPLAAADVQSIVDDSFLKLRNAATGKPERVSDRQIGDRLVVSVTDVPPARRAQIEASLRSAGRPVTDANIVAAYTTYLSRLPAAPVPQP